MFGKIPLRESKQSLLASTSKNYAHNLKETCKSKQQPIKAPIAKQNIPQKHPVKTSKITPIQSKEVVVPQRQVLVKSIKPRMPIMSQVKQNLHPCKQCGRTFIQTALKRHQKICKKIFINKRKQFNSAKQRFVSKEQTNLFKKNKDKNDSKVEDKHRMMPLWKQQSMAFRLAMKQVRGGEKTEEELEYLKKQKKIIKSSMFKCNHCGRSFNEEAGKRHEVFCAQKAKDMSSKLKDKSKLIKQSTAKMNRK